jgi:hypothetical protein
MTSPTLELQGAIVARLKANGAVSAIVGARVYDRVPRGTDGNISATMPFVGITSFDELTEDADCVPGSSISLNLDCWSDKPGFPEVHALTEAVKQALHDDDTITLTTNALVYLTHIQTRTLRDPDGLTSHGIVTFEAAVEIK